jgi:hypothetical protein
MYLNAPRTGQGHRSTQTREGALMRKAGLKGLFTLLSLNRAKDRPHWDRIILIFSTSVTLGLIAMYVYEKVGSRW